MELVYLWVEDYKNIQKQGFNFSFNDYSNSDECSDSFEYWKKKLIFQFKPLNWDCKSYLLSWEQGRSPVSRVALIPTIIRINQIYYRSIEILYTNVFCLYKLFIYANLCRDEGNLTYSCTNNYFKINLIRTEK